jgi:hypothetical protein
MTEWKCIDCGRSDEHCIADCMTALKQENFQLHADNLSFALINKTTSDEVCIYIKENEKLRELFKEAIPFVKLVCGLNREHLDSKRDWLDKAKELIGE